MTSPTQAYFEHERLVYHVYRRINRSDLTARLREDLLQEGRLALLRAIDKYDATKGASLSTYAYLLIRGAMLNYLRRERKQPLLSLQTPLSEDGDLSLEDLIAAPDSAVDEACDADIFISRLDQYRKSILTLVKKGYSLRDISAQFGVPTPWVRNALRALRVEYRNAVPFIKTRLKELAND